MTTYDIKVNTDSDSDIQPKIYSLGPITDHMVEKITGIDTEWVRVELVDGADIVAFEGLLNADPDVYEYRMTVFPVGHRVEGGEGEDHDTGTIVSIESDTMCTVAWQSGCTTSTVIADLREA